MTNKRIKNCASIIRIIKKYSFKAQFSNTVCETSSNCHDFLLRRIINTFVSDLANEIKETSEISMQNSKLFIAISPSISRRGRQSFR